MSAESDWIDAFRDNGGPPLYLNMNRTPTLIDYHIFIIVFGFCAVFFSFLIILPGIRREKVSTFVVVTVSLVIGCSIGVAYWGSSWHVANASIYGQYRAGTDEKNFADVGVHIGLKSVNITYKANSSSDINYNERFYFVGPTEMKREHENAKARGLPYAILTITEYLSKSDEGFCWGFQYRSAGYYAANLLIIATALWITMLVLLCAVPRYGFYTLVMIGGLMLVTAAVYSFLLPRRPLIIPFERGTLSFKYGWCFWLVIGAGATAVVFGAAISLVDYLFPNRFSTILEVDYDTPYRYFVGNDAHLFGGLANGQHTAATATNSAATESTCCGQKPISKQKSDASVSTMESYPVERFNFITHKNLTNKFLSSSTSSSAITSPCSTTSTRIITRAVIERGKENDAFENGDEKENDVDSKTVVTSSTSISTTVSKETSETLESGENILKTGGGIKSEKIERAEKLSDNSTDSVANEESSKDVSTDIVRGKRAVSLHNFGKFTERQKRDRDKETFTKTPTKNRNSNKLPSTHL